MFGNFVINLIIIYVFTALIHDYINLNTVLSSRKALVTNTCV
jgi:hypothetical protein